MYCHTVGNHNDVKNVIEPHGVFHFPGLALWGEKVKTLNLCVLVLEVGDEVVQQPVQVTGTGSVHVRSGNTTGRR